jgi:cytosine deaminase
MLDLLLRRARLLDQAGEHDVAIRDGRIAQVAALIDVPAARRVDLEGRLVLPGFVDSHLHLDKAYLNEIPDFHGLTGPAFFAKLKELKQRRPVEDLHNSMRRALEACASHGTTTIRAQIDVDDVVGLRGLQAALSLKAAYAPRLDVQIVAFPQEGLATNHKARDLVEEALRLGADVLGGGATFDAGQTDAHVDLAFELATRFNVDLDFHSDLQTRPNTPLEEWELFKIANCTVRHGWQGRVTVAHLTQLGQMPEEPAAEVCRLLAKRGIHVTVVPAAELNTATTWSVPAAHSVDQAMTRHDLLLRHGVNLSYATGHVADAFSPYGCGDMLLDGLLLASARNLGCPRLAGTHILQLGTTNPARALRLTQPYGVQAEALADLVCLDAAESDMALRHHAPIHVVLKSGRILGGW